MTQSNAAQCLPDCCISSRSLTKNRQKVRRLSGGNVTEVITLNPDDSNEAVFAGILQSSPTAIKLTSLTANRTDAGVEVRWTTSTEIDTFGFRVLCSTR